MQFLQVLIAITSPAWIIGAIMYGVHKMTEYEKKVLWSERS